MAAPPSSSIRIPHPRAHLIPAYLRPRNRDLNSEAIRSRRRVTRLEWATIRPGAAYDVVTAPRGTTQNPNRRERPLSQEDVAVLNLLRGVRGKRGKKRKNEGSRTVRGGIGEGGDEERAGKRGPEGRATVQTAPVTLGIVVAAGEESSAGGGFGGESMWGVGFEGGDTDEGGFEDEGNQVGGDPGADEMDHRSESEDDFDMSLIDPVLRNL